MMRHAGHSWLEHPRPTRREAMRIGAVSILGLGTNHLQSLRADEHQEPGARASAQSCIYIFLSGGLSQHESFDPKPDAPAEIRGEFQPIATQTPGVSICEHLPMLAQRSDLWSICRSLTHPSNDHSAGHHIMLTGRSDLPRGFDPNRASSKDHPSMVAITGRAFARQDNLPPAVVLPEKLVHSTGRVIPGQFGGAMGQASRPWFIEASTFHNAAYGAYPEFTFDHQRRGKKDDRRFEAPSLSLPEEMVGARLAARRELLSYVERQSRLWDHSAEVESFDRSRQGAISLLTDPSLRKALDVTNASDRDLDRYGRNSFGWSLLMARRLVESGVKLIQVNLGNNETWDTHGNAFPHLKEQLLPPMDRAVSGLLDDLREMGLLDSTLIVMGSEFGRTPRVSHLKQHYALPGRDHWGAVQSVFFAGGGVKGGQVIGASDRSGGFPVDAPQTPEKMAATIYSALGIPRQAHWLDESGRPNMIYQGESIPGLLG